MACKPSRRARGLHSTDIMQLHLVPKIHAHRALKLLVQTSMCKTIHKTYRSDCFETDKALAVLSCSPSLRATSLHGFNITQPGLSSILHTTGHSGYCAHVLQADKDKELTSQLIARYMKALQAFRIFPA